jgi:hypothetical protein
MDDILIMNRSYQGVQSDLQTVVAMMEGLGFLIYKEKSELQPKQKIEFNFPINWANFRTVTD